MLVPFLTALAICANLLLIGQQFLPASANATFHANMTDSEEAEWPHVPDPNIPRLPFEFLSDVDKTCRSVYFVGNRLWRSIPDRSLIKYFEGCKMVSRGFCHSNFVISPPTRSVFYKRSFHGVWFAGGPSRSRQKKCRGPMEFPRILLKMLHELVHSLTSSKHYHNKEENSVAKLPRIADLPLPAILPPKFARKYADECRFVKFIWNINFRNTSDSEMYRGCKMVPSLSRNYCFKPERKGPGYEVQTIFVRSRTAGFEIGGIRSNSSWTPACDLGPHEFVENSAVF